MLQVGFVQSMIQNEVYALPPNVCTLFCDTAAATFEQSNTVEMTAAVAVTPDTNEQIEVAGGFIRVTSAGPVNVHLKRV